MGHSVATEDIIAAYMATGSVWKTGKRVGLAGQTVHDRLVSAGHKLQNPRWTTEELDEMRSLHEAGVSLGEIARRLNRPYSGCATKSSEMKLGFNRTRGSEKLPRGAGYDKAATLRHMRALEVYKGAVTQYARSQGLRVEQLVQAFERYVPDRWTAYVAGRSDIPERECEYCGQVFIPSTGKQRFHSRRCASTARADRDYFGGRRSEAVGMAAGVCQVCGVQGKKGLSAHHVLGKENDPDNDVLVAVCQGCHNLIGMLGRSKMVDDPAVLESLIALAWLRRHGGSTLEEGELWVHVDIHRQPLEEDAPQDLALDLV